MSKKFFSLIYEKRLALAPKTKIVPSEAFSELLDGGQILEAIHNDAEEYRLQIAKECEEIKEAAYRKGFEEGFQAFAEQIAKMEEEIVKVHSDMEKMVLPVALKAAKKIVGRELEVSETAIVDIVRNNLKAVAQHKKVTIYVNKADLKSLESHRSDLKALFEHLEALSIREREDIKQGGCVIETEVGIINAQIDNQWAVLERAFQSASKKR
jgi:type III secretion protein L